MVDSVLARSRVGITFNMYSYSENYTKVHNSRYRTKFPKNPSSEKLSDYGHVLQISNNERNEEGLRTAPDISAVEA